MYRDEEVDLVLQHMRRRKLTSDQAQLVLADAVASLVESRIELGIRTREDVAQATEQLYWRIRERVGIGSRPGDPGGAELHHE